MHRLFKLFILPTLVFGVFLNPVQADTLAMPEKAKAEAKTYSIDLPGRGMTMAEVEKRFGPPGRKDDEVGDPPITRWVYENFVVYFEYQYVIHAIATQPAP